MPLQITITDAGRAEVINANNTGTGPVTIAEIGLGTGQYTPAPDQTAMAAETKRLATIAGQVVSADTIHVTIKDETGDAYTVNEIGLYTDSGTLFAVYSDPVNPIAQKASASALLLAVDIVLGTLDANSLTFGDTSFAMPPASETVPGISEVATQAETDDGEDDGRFVTPKKLKSNFESKKATSSQALSGEAVAKYMPPDLVHAAFNQFGIGTGVTASNEYSSNQDMNSFVKSGQYFVGGNNNANTPNGLSSGAWSILVNNNQAGHGYISQIAVGIDPLLDAYVRTYKTGAWGAWRKIADSRNIIDIVKAVDGIGSGLDTDLIRGLPGDFTSSKAFSGYQKLPSGLVIQWINGGRHTGTETGGSFTLTLPIAFPTQTLMASVTTVGDGSSFSDTMFQVVSATKTSVTLFPQWFGSGGTEGLCAPQVIAIGY